MQRVKRVKRTSVDAQTLNNYWDTKLLTGTQYFHRDTIFALFAVLYNKAEGNYRVWVCKEHINNGNNNTASSHNYSAGSNAGFPASPASPAHSDNQGRGSGQGSHQERLCHMRNIKDADLIAEIRRQWEIRTRNTAQTVAQMAQTAAQSARTEAQFAETKLEVIFYKIQRIIVNQDKIEIEWVTAR